jgi:hypothetical protein
MGLATNWIYFNQGGLPTIMPEGLLATTPEVPQLAAL